jgi:hypothetical protein
MERGWENDRFSLAALKTNANVVPHSLAPKIRTSPLNKILT